MPALLFIVMTKNLWHIPALGVMSIIQVYFGQIRGAIENKKLLESGPYKYPDPDFNKFF